MLTLVAMWVPRTLCSMCVPEASQHFSQWTMQGDISDLKKQTVKNCSAMAFSSSLLSGHDRSDSVTVRSVFLLFFTKTLISLIWIMSKVLFMVYKFGLQVRRWVVRKIYKWIKTLTLKQIESLRYTQVLYTKTPFSPVKSLILSFTQTQFFTVSCFVIKLMYFFFDWCQLSSRICF